LVGFQKKFYWIFFPFEEINKEKSKKEEMNPIIYVYTILALLFVMIGLQSYLIYYETQTRNEWQKKFEGELKGRFTGFGIALGAIADAAGVSNTIRERVQATIQAAEKNKRNT
jgi:hypothetical protein